MKKLALTAMVALALVLTFTQCKKESEKPEATEEKVFVTLTATMGQNEDKTDFNTGDYSFVWTSGATEIVYVGGSQHSGCFGLLYGTGTGTGTMNFSGWLTSMPQNGEFLYFFYLGKGGLKQGDAMTTLDFSNQDGTLASLTKNHIAISYGIAFGGSLYFDATFYPISSFAYLNTSGFGAEPVSLHGEDVYSKATVDFQHGTITGSAKGNISIGSGSNGAYVALIPSTTDETTLQFDGYTKTGSLDFLRGIQPGRYYCKNNGAALQVETSELEQVDLSTLTGDYEAQNGDILTNTLGGNYKISIAPGAKVTLNGVTINGVNDEQYNWAGLTCEGDATIILVGTNSVKGFFYANPGIHIPQGSTLTIKGVGELTALTNILAPGDPGYVPANDGRGFGAGIGGGFQIPCGNIRIEGGTINASGRLGSAGIGGAFYGDCGDITIVGGTINAGRGTSAPGIGGGYDAECGTITIANTVNCVTVTSVFSEEDPYPAPHSIGMAADGSCGTVSIGGTVYWDGENYKNGGENYLPQIPFVYQPQSH